MNRYIGFYNFVDFGFIEFDVNYFRLLGVFRHVAGNAVIETHADGDQYIA